MQAAFELKMALRWGRERDSNAWKCRGPLEIKAKSQELQGCHHLFENKTARKFIQKAGQVSWGEWLEEISGDITTCKLEIEHDFELGLSAAVWSGEDFDFLVGRSKCSVYSNDAKDHWAYTVNDLPIVGVGSTILEAHQNCEIALTSHIRGMIRDGIDFDRDDLRLDIKKFDPRDATDVLDSMGIIFPISLEIPE